MGSRHVGGHRQNRGEYCRRSIGFLLGAQIFIQGNGNGISGYGEHVGIERSA